MNRGSWSFNYDHNSFNRGQPALVCKKEQKNKAQVLRHFRQSIFLDRNGDPIAAAQRDFMTMTKTCLWKIQRLFYFKCSQQRRFLGTES